jgi:pimeloyl-ACP methyl ester carboxylesterase
MQQRRRSIRRAVRAAVAAALAVAVLASVPSPARATTRTRHSGTHTRHGAPVPVLRWTDCGNGFQCTTATVPLDYDHPTGRTIELALMRRPADDPAHKIGSVFVNPGGPGGSGIEFLADFGSDLFSDKVRARFDIIGFDPRGVGQSTPLRCFNTEDEAFGALAPYSFPVTRDEENIWIAADRRVARACADRHPRILDHMSTANVARDLDLLRRAVGDRGLTYWGISYGSILGATYANLFPENVRALALDGVADPVEWYTGRHGEGDDVPVFNRVGASGGSSATLDQYFALCDAAGPRCALSEGSPRRRFEKLARALRTQPVILEEEGETVEVGYDELVSTTLDFLYFPDEWAQLAEMIRSAEDAVAARTTATAAGAVFRLRALEATLGVKRAVAQEPYANEIEAGPGVTCSETDNPDHVGAWRRVAHESDREDRYFGRPWTWLTSICQVWPGHDSDRYTGPFTATTANPVLLVNPTYDPATPYEGARAVNRLIPRARLLTVDGWGHTSFFAGSTCADRAVSRYLLKVVLPARATVCPVDHVPFTDIEVG